MYDLIIIGGGAAGIFAAISAKAANACCRVLVLEKTELLLTKVKASGGGRCNLTNLCAPKDLVKNYPRGSREMLGPFHHFQPQDIMRWFEERNVLLKVEAENRVFPVSNSSETIVSCLLDQAKRMNVEIVCQQTILKIDKGSKNFEVSLPGTTLHAKNILLATGSSSDGFLLATQFGHTIIDPVPSLFAFNIPESPFQELAGISVDSVGLRLMNTSFSQTGSILLTHFGLSGPAVLKLSSWAARYLFEHNYEAILSIDWLPDQSHETFDLLSLEKSQAPDKTIRNLLTQRLWKALLNYYGFPREKKMRDLSLKELKKLSDRLHNDTYSIKGKYNNKQEFVTCGGVKLSEVNFTTMESKMCEGLYFAGEILDIDGLTGGFNLQNAWTTAYIAGQSCAKKNTVEDT